MAGPPSGVSGSDLWVKLSQRPRPHTVVPFPGPPGEECLGDVALIVLTDSELMQARASADTAAKEVLRGDIKPGDIGYQEIYASECAVQILAQAARDPKDHELRTFISPKHLRQKLTTDEIGALITMYGEFRRQRGPYLAELSADELEAWVKVLMEGASRAPLALLSGEALKDLILFLVSRLPGSRTAPSSAGSPPDGSSTVTSEVSPPASEIVDEGEHAQKE